MRFDKLANGRVVVADSRIHALAANRSPRRELVQHPNWLDHEQVSNGTHLVVFLRVEQVDAVIACQLFQRGSLTAARQLKQYDIGPHACDNLREPYGRQRGMIAGQDGIRGGQC